MWGQRQVAPASALGELSLSCSLQRVSGWSTVPDYFVGPAFFRGRLWIEQQPQDTFLKLQASPGCFYQGV